MFEFNNSGELDTEFTNVNPFFFSFQFEGSESIGKKFISDFFILDLYGTKYHYKKDFGKDGITLLSGIYENKVRNNRNIGISELKKVLQKSEKEFTNLIQAYTLDDIDFKILSQSKFDTKYGIHIYYTPPWHKHLSLSIWFYNEYFNFYQECLLWAEEDNSGKAINLNFFNPSFDELRIYCSKVFKIDFQKDLK